MLCFYDGTPTSVIAGLFTNSISLGTALVGIMLLAFATYFAWKNKALESAQGQASASAQSAEQWRDDYLASRQLDEDHQRQASALLASTEHRAAESLAAMEAKYEEQRALKHALETENAALRMATDLSSVMKALTDMASSFASFSEVQQAQTRVLEAIEQRLAT